MPSLLFAFFACFACKMALHLVTVDERWHYFDMYWHVVKPVRFMRYRACWMMQRFAQADFQDPQTILRCLNNTLQVGGVERERFPLLMACACWCNCQLCVPRRCADAVLCCVVLCCAVLCCVGCAVLCCVGFVMFCCAVVVLVSRVMSCPVLWLAP